MFGRAKPLTRHRLDGRFIQDDIGLDVDLTSVHGAETLEVGIGARIQFLLEDPVAVCKDLELSRDISRNVRDTDNVEGQGLVVWREDDVEEGGGEARVGHARVERVGFDHALGRGEGRDERKET